jgi:hypothetical protein
MVHPAGAVPPSLTELSMPHSLGCPRIVVTAVFVFFAKVGGDAANETRPNAATPLPAQCFGKDPASAGPLDPDEHGLLSP